MVVVTLTALIVAAIVLMIGVMGATLWTSYALLRLWPPLLIVAVLAVFVLATRLVTNIIQLI